MSEFRSSVGTIPLADDPVLQREGSRPEMAYRFGDFELSIGSRTLRRDGKIHELGGRAFDLLATLLRARGAVVSKRELMQEAWPSMIVDESNLRFQMACIRRVLGPERDLIKTVQGRGYLFVAEAVTVTGAAFPRQADPAPPLSPARTDSDRLGTVAVVEDDDNTRQALDGLLRSAGFAVETYATAQDLMVSGRAHSVDCLVLDVWLPGRSGLEFQSDLKNAGIDVPIVFISGHADVHMSVRAMKAGAFEFLTKPVRHEDLLTAIQSAVATPRDSRRPHAQSL